MTNEMPVLDEKALAGIADIVSPPSGRSQGDVERIIIADFVEWNVAGYDPYRELRMWVLMHPAAPCTGKSDNAASLGNWRFAAATRKPGGRRVENSETVELIYLSIGNIERKEMWKAVVYLPAAPNRNTLMEVEVTGADGLPERGRFQVAGVSVELQGGKGVIKYLDFADGIRDQSVFLERTPGRPVNGVLALI